MKKVNHCETGRFAEQFVARYLLTLGYHIWKTNWRWGRRELDLVAIHRDQLVIIEVKSRVDNRVNLPSEVVDHRKQRNIVIAADAFIRLYHCCLPTRFDVIAVIYSKGEPRIEHIQNAFYPGVE